MGVPLKWRNSPVNYFRITFLSALSEKKIQILFCVHEQRSFIWNTNLLPVDFPSLCAFLLQIWDPCVLRIYFVQQWPFHSRKLCTQLFAQVAWLHMLTVHGAIWCHSGTGFSARSQKSFPFLHILSSQWGWTPLCSGSIPGHSSGCNATVYTLQVRFLLTPKPFPSCSQMRIQVSRWLVLC